jgi:hypothetical protein
MFGLFKKPSIEKTLRHSVQIWNSLSESDKIKSATNISVFCSIINAECDTRKSVFFKIAEMRVGVVKEFNVKSENHPLIMQLNIIGDYFYSAWNEPNLFFESMSLMVQVEGTLDDATEVSVFKESIRKISALE